MKSLLSILILCLLSCAPVLGVELHPLPTNTVSSVIAPANAAPVIAIETTVVVVVPVDDTNAWYTLEYCDDLVEGDWKPTYMRDHHPIATGDVFFAEPAPCPPNRSYRLKVEYRDQVYSNIVGGTETNAPAESLTNAVMDVAMAPPPPLPPLPLPYGKVTE